MTDELIDAKMQELKSDMEKQLEHKAGVELKKELSPLEELRELEKDTRSMLDEMKNAELRLQKATADAILSGRTEAGFVKTKPKDPHEIARQKGLEFAKRIMG